MKICEKHKYKIVLQACYSHFEYQVMFVKLPIIAINFQGYINKIITKKLDTIVIVYLNNILTYTDNNKNSHIAIIQYVLG